MVSLNSASSRVLWASCSCNFFLERGDTAVVVKSVPAQVCENCGEYYLDGAVAARVSSQGEAAVARHAGVAVLRYAA
ncbi:type II toxin-antitoxin system MqsA family antitoxin [Nitrococcus mobilis]|uniref:type II toxin-antitoxin system MqsA family antitoxin n=1 Tax=Nitrococcus mobilis TaxID=35797 RepID=UPI0009FE7546|nr:type II toxin-antitoxin system MqsA family antitoxin [Nitrococcus mobilis]